MFIVNIYTHNAVLCSHDTIDVLSGGNQYVNVCMCVCV